MSTLARAVVLVVAGALLGAVGNAVRPHGLKVAAFAPPTQCTGGEGHGAVEVLEPAAATSLCGQADVVIADTRAASAFAEGDVAGGGHRPGDAQGVTAVEARAPFR